MDNYTGFTILIADRNPNVRDLLKRELMSVGYRVLQAKDSREVLKQVFSQKALDLLILDPDLAELEATDIFKKLNNRIPRLPVVIHSLQTDYEKYSQTVINTVFVEKQGNSVEHLKMAVSRILKNKKERTFQ